MTWLILSLTTALSVAVRDLLVKIYSKDRSPMEIGAAELFWSLPLLLAGLPFVPIPALDAIFWWTFILSLPLNGLAYVLYLYSLKLSPLSLTVPFLAFTPVFILLTGFLVLGETVSPYGAFGIFLIVAGSYIIHFDPQKSGLFIPFTSLFREKGSLLMLLVAFLYSFAAVIGKKAMAHSSPLFFTYTFFVTFNVLMLVTLKLLKKVHLATAYTMCTRGLVLGVLLVIHLSCHALAIMLTKAAYMIAVKRSSIVFTVLLSWLVLREENIAFRGLGTLLMFCGVVCIALWG